MSRKGILRDRVYLLHMKILVEYPPNIEAIASAFPDAVKSRSVIFAYRGDIYNPFDLPIGPQNVAHEQVHFVQQKEIGTETWWRAYIADPEFRVAQEIPAYRAEYNYIKDHTNDRERIARASRQMASALSGPNYGRCMSFNDALLAIVSPRI